MVHYMKYILDGASNTAEENSSICCLIRMHEFLSERHAGSETLRQENPAVLN